MHELPNRTYRTQPFLGFDLACLDVPYFITDTLTRARERSRPHIISYLNAERVQRAVSDEGFARDLSRFDCLHAGDGAMVLATRLMRRPVPEGIRAEDFIREFIAGVAEGGLKLALIGGVPKRHTAHGEAELAARTFQRWAPDLQVVYIHHGHFDERKASIIEQELEEANPDLVLMSMAEGVQERYALRWSRSLAPRTWWCVGDLFEYCSGSRWLAPVWMRRCRLAWVLRIFTEPHRRFKYYCVDYPRLIRRALGRKAIKGAGPQSSF